VTKCPPNWTAHVFKICVLYNSAYLSGYDVCLLLLKIYSISYKTAIAKLFTLQSQTCHVLLSTHYIKQIFQINVVVLNKGYFIHKPFLKKIS
jgi:hypothetical protein